MSAYVEDRRFKAAGLIVLAIAGAMLAWMTHRAAVFWSLPDSQRLIGDLAWQSLVCANLAAGGLLLLGIGCAAPSLRPRPGRKRAMLLWSVLSNLAAMVVLGGVLDADEQLTQWMQSVELTEAVEVATAAIMLLAFWLWRRSQRHVAPSADEAMRDDPRLPLLYLRSFADDEEALLDDGGARWVGWIPRLMGLPTPEQDMASLLCLAGPVVAIGRPDETLPRLGAARLYVQGDAWKQAILSLLDQARLVVLRVGATPGVRWEIDQALARVPRERLVLAFHGRSAYGLPESVRQRLQHLVGMPWDQALPQSRSGVVTNLFANSWGRRMGSLVCFPEAGQVAVIPISMRIASWRDWPTAFSWSMSSMPLRLAWIDVFRRLRVDAGALGADRSRATAVLLAVLVGYAGAHWFYLRQPRKAWRRVAMIVVSIYLGWWDALRFVWMSRTEFQSLAGPAKHTIT
jgi:hypothetical protein